METIAERILKMARNQTVFRAHDVGGTIDPRSTLRRMVMRGDITRVGRGLYALPDAEVGANHSPSRPKGTPARQLALARSHWEIGNCLHHPKDRSLGEDADRTRLGASTMARVRSLGAGLLVHVAGNSVPQKQVRIAARPSIAVSLLKRKRFPAKQI